MMVGALSCSLTGKTDPRQHGQHASHLQVHHGRPALVDGDLARSACCRQPSGEHLGHLEKVPEPSVNGRAGVGSPGGQVAMAKRRKVQADDRCDRINAWQPGQRAQVARGEANWRDKHIRGFGGLQEARVSTVCPQRPRNRGQHSAAGDGHQQNQHRPASPPGTQLMSGEIYDRPHALTPHAGRGPRP
jgi:hypothetical protein